MTRVSRWVVVLVLAGGSATGAQAVEPWADPKLPVKDGIELWLDATHPAEKKRADGPLDVWADASGRGRHLRQTSEANRPTLLPAGASAAVRFDGLDDHLRAIKQGTELKSFTVFVALVPRNNPGGFRGFLAFNAADRRDYESGITLDTGSLPTAQFTALNVEGRGFGGERNLLKPGGPFGRLYTLEVRAPIDAKTVRLLVDGQPSGERPRSAEPISLDEITLGARYYSNEPGPQRVQGFGRADIAEVLVYGRAVDDDEAKKVRDYLSTKHAGLADALPPDGDGRGEILVPIADPPPIQMLVPGFTVRELPLDLPNINNVKCRPDGTMLAVGYDGDIWLLRDSDRDGIPDKADRFWENKGRLRAPIGAALTPPGYEHGDGIFVASKGKCSLIVDKDGDGKADKEIIVADGWKEIFVAVDAVGVAVDPRDGSVWFGRGCYDFSNAFRVGKDGKAAYSLKDDTGTVIRVAPDFKSREVICTGVRFPVSMAFNRHGDLFCTEQEGATWLPNGNPFDELLHIQKGRHYGFPPRHPTHLPNVIDEPSVFDYGPQHQSTCGFCFNEPVKANGPIFGPAGWAGDALVTGESRGKFYRTQLVKTSEGYIARNHLLACLKMLTVDVCVTGDGGLLVACHSGGPDWGTGPTGKGKLFKITYTDREHPQPALVWPAGPREVRVEFDRPVDPGQLRDVLRQTKLTAGAWVRAGDRFESIWPGYAVIQMEKVTPRYDVPVRSAQLTPDRQTLVLATDPMPPGLRFALTLPGMGRPSQAQTPKGALPQHTAIDLDFDLSGCVATWTPKEGEPWNGWLPHPNLDTARRFTAGSAAHDALWEAMKRPGRLELKGQLNLNGMLRPAVQPGGRLDYELPPEKVTLKLEARAELAARLDGTPAPQAHPNHVAAGPFTPRRDDPLRFEFSLDRPSDPALLRVSWSTAEDERARAFSLSRTLLPWASLKRAIPEAQVKVPELDGGSWARGRKLFFEEATGCVKCHTVGGRGGVIGPDLSNLIHRDYASVMRDITVPSFAINPDYLTAVVQLNDGRTLQGVVRTVEGKLHIGDQNGTTTIVDPARVESMQPSPVSTMPEGQLKTLGTEKTRDLMTFLLTPPPSMPRDYAGPRPKPRPAAEVLAVLAGAPSPPLKTRPIRIVLVAGPKDHGRGEHDYPAWQKAWKELMAAADNIEVVTAWEWPEAEEFRKADVMVFYQRGDWTAKRAADVDAFLERGGGLVYVHWAVDGRADGPGFAKRIGLAAGGPIKFRHGPLDLAFNTDAKHPITRNFDRLHLVDESYWLLTGKLPAERVLASAVEEKEARPLFWSMEHGRGRVFVSIPGHYSWTFDDPLYRVLLLRGIAWSAREPVDRFNDLVWPGADVAR